MSEHLLPGNATPFERAGAGTVARLSDVPTPIEQLWRPWDCREDLLPWLAWALSVDVWDDDWPEERKRSVVARAIALHRIKGTEAGLKAHVALADAAVRQLVVPPQGVFASRTLTKAEMDAWLRTMPQIRVYLAREVGSAAGLSFAGAATESDVAFGFWGQAFASFDAGRALLGRAARLWDREEETRLLIWDLHSEREERRGLRIERVSLPGKAGFGLFVGGFFGRGFASAEAKPARLVTWRQDVAYEHRMSALSMRSAHPGLDPVDVRSERVSETGDAGPWAFVRRFAGTVFATRDDAAWMLFDRIVLHDPERAAPLVSAQSFAGVSRLGIADYTALSVIDLKDRAASRTFAAGVFAGAAFALPEDTRKRTATRRAAIASKALRDRILVTHKTTRPRTFGDGFAIDGPNDFGARMPFRL